MYNNGFVSLINSFTRITSDSSSCIDHNFARHKKLRNFTAGIFHLEITDHSLIALIINDEKTIDKQLKNNSSTVTYEKINFDVLKDYLRNYDWNVVLSKDIDVDNGLDELYSVINKSISMSKELKEIKYKYHKAKC